jgi:hypothetical protein
MRPLGFCRHLAAHGWDPVVVAAEPASAEPHHHADASLEQLLPIDVEVHRVAHRSMLHVAIDIRERWRSAARTREAAASTATLAAPRPNDRPGRVSLYKEIALRHTFEFPDLQASWLRPAVRRALHLSSREPVDAVFATGSPWTGLLAGRDVAAALGVPLVADFRDPWTMNTNLWQQPSFVQRARRAERLVCERADAIVTVTDPLSESFRSVYPQCASKVVTITNGFDEAIVAGQFETPPASPEGVPIELWHFGSVYGPRNPVRLLRALSGLTIAGAVHAGSLRVHFVGPWLIHDEETEALALRLQELGVISRQAGVPRDEALRRMRAAPILLALQPNLPLQIPAKVYEYAVSGRPTVVIGGEGATARLVTDNGFGVCCPDDEHAIASLLRGLLSGTTVPAPDPGLRRKFSYDTLAGQLAGVLDSITTRGSSLAKRRVG